MDPGMFAQYGAIGVIAAMALAAVRTLFKREVAAHEREQIRADRLEAELRELNNLIRDQFMTTLGAATQAIKDADDAVTNALVAVRRESR